MKSCCQCLGLENPKTCNFIYFAWYAPQHTDMSLFLVQTVHLLNSNRTTCNQSANRLCALVIGCGNMVFASNTNSCFAVVCRSSCSQVGFPDDIPQYPTLEQAFLSVPLGCGQKNAFQILLSSIENYPDFVVPTTVANVSFITYRSTLPGIPYSRPILGKLIQKQSDQLNLHFSHLTWFPASTNPDCLEVTNWAPLVSIDADDSVIMCSFPPIEYLQVVLRSSTLSSGKTQSFRVLGSFLAENMSFHDKLEIWMGVDTQVFSLSNSTLYESMKVTAHTQKPLFNISSTVFNRETELKMPYTRVLATPSLLIDDEPSRNISILQSQLSSFQSDSQTNRVSIESSTFLSRLILEGDYLDLDFHNNTVHGSKVGPSVYFAYMSLGLSSSCLVRGRIENNRFMSGTAYLYIPAPNQKSLAGCPLTVNIFSELLLQHNQFAAWNGSTSNASLSIFLVGDYQVPRSQFELLSIDASRNWWGDAHGPYLCCNLKGKGSFATQLIRQDHWCLDSDCTSFSDVVLPVECRTTCCPQKLSKPFVGIFVLVAVVTYLALLVVTFFNVIRVRRNFSSKAFQSSQREDLIEKIVPMLYQSVVASLVGCFGTIIMGVMIGTLYKTQEEIPRQEKLPLAGVVYVILFSSVVLIQLISTLLCGLSILLRKRYRSILIFLSSKQFFINAFVVIYMIVIALIWGPYSLIFQPICHKSAFLKADQISDSYWSSYDSGHAALIAVLIAPIALTAIAIMIPQHTLNNLLYRYEYASINYVLEDTLLDDLAKAPEVTKKAQRLRISAIVSLILVIANAAACIYALTLPLVPPREAIGWAFAYTVWGKPRVINLACVCILGILTMAGTIGLSFSYNRALVINVLSAITILVVTSIFNTNVFEWAGLIFLHSQGIRAFLLKGAVQVLGFLVVISFMTTWVLLLKLKSAVTDELPKLAVSNLNSHLDDSWHSSALSQDAPLLAYSQDDPLLTRSTVTNYASQ